MLKRIMIALAGVFAMFGLLAAPGANGAEPAFIGSVLLADGQGHEVTVPENEIPTQCGAIPAELASVRAAANNTTMPGTSVEFFRDAGCLTVPLRLDPGESDGDIFPPDGAIRWQVAS